MLLWKIYQKNAEILKPSSTKKLSAAIFSILQEKFVFEKFCVYSK
jgi:hypothetical protein